MNKVYCDVLIFGAGIIGSSLAIRLAQSGIKVIIIDNKYPVLVKNNSVPNIRVSAINYASVKFFKNIDIWKNIPIHFCTPYCHLETWEWKSATVVFHSNSIGLSEMGYIIENNRLQLALWKNFTNCNMITLYCPCTFITLKYDSPFWKCLLSNKIIVVSRLLVGADGSNSQIRKALGIGISGWNFHQCCMLLTIKIKKFKYKTIWQAFTPHGIISFLPLYNHWGVLMWFNTPEYIYSLQHLSISVLKKKIEKHFYNQLGKISLYNTSVFPLINQRAYKYIVTGGVIIGDAAHTIHPFAGQGINLGIRDVISLSKLLIDSKIFYTHSDISENFLLSYQNDRRYDIYMMQTSINWLYFIFHNNCLPLKIIRNAAFIIIDCLPCIKKIMLKYATGYK